MRALVRQAMNEGAMGVGSSLIYAPGNFAETDELVALVTEAGRCGGMYISHMRSEGDRLLQSIDELVEIARRSGAPAEIYHLKLAGRDNWGNYAEVIRRIEAARAAGLRITADMYTYTAGATGLDASMPLWVQAGGLEAWIERLQRPGDPRAGRRRDARPGKGWENLYLGAGRRQDDPARDSAIRRCAAIPARPWPRSRELRARARRRRRWTWSSRTTAGSARSIS